MAATTETEPDTSPPPAATTDPTTAIDEAQAAALEHDLDETWITT